MTKCDQVSSFGRKMSVGSKSAGWGRSLGVGYCLAGTGRGVGGGIEFGRGSVAGNAQRGIWGQRRAFICRISQSLYGISLDVM